MFSIFRRLAICFGCLLYAGACVALVTGGVSQGETAWVLLAIAIAHVIFGAEAIVLCFSAEDDPREEIDHIRAEQDANRANLQALVDGLEKRVAELSIEVADLRRATGATREPAEPS